MNTHRVCNVLFDTVLYSTGPFWILLLKSAAVLLFYVLRFTYSSHLDTYSSDEYT